MKYLILLLPFVPLSADAITWNQFWRPFENGAYYRSPVYYSPPQVCTEIVHHREYVPGNGWRYGYVRTWSERVRVPCNIY